MIVEFSNPNFARGQPDLLCHIHRQKSRADNPASHLPDTELALDLPTLLTDLAAVRKHQSALTTDLAALEKSNRALWEEAIQSRERQKGHQETITKILRFLGTVFGGAQANAGAAKGTTASNVTEEVQDRGREGNDKGKGKEVSVQRRSRLLLEDVKERRDARAREMQIAEEDADYEEEDDDTIEEIGSQGNFTPITTGPSIVPSIVECITDDTLQPRNTSHRVRTSHRRIRTQLFRRFPPNSPPDLATTSIQS